jgi:hypothetical protein
MLVSAAAPSSLHRLPIAGVCLPLSPTSSRRRRCLLFPPLPGAVAWLHGLAWCCSPQWALLRHSRPPPRARAAYEHFLSLGTSRHPACRHGCARGGPHRGGEIEDERSEKGGGRPQRMERRVAWRDARGEDLTGAGRSRMRGRRREEVGRSGWRGGSRGVGSLVVAPEGDADPPCGRLRGQRGPVAPPHLDLLSKAVAMRASDANRERGCGDWKLECEQCLIDWFLE